MYSRFIIYNKCANWALGYHPSIHFLYPLNRVVGGLEPIPAGKPWTGHQSITGPHRDKQPHTRSQSLLRTILETPINPTCMLLDGGRKPEYPERTHAYTGRTCKLHTERPQVGVGPGTLSLWGVGDNHHTTVQPYLFIYWSWPNMEFVVFASLLPGCHLTSMATCTFMSKMNGIIYTCMTFF